MITDDHKLKIFDEFIASLKKEVIFPENVDYRSSRYDFFKGCYCCISWELNNDKSFKNKQSKIIKLMISEEVLEDYAEENDLQNKKELKRKFISFVKNRYKNFDPDHDKKRYQPRPLEEWVFTGE